MMRTSGFSPIVSFLIIGVSLFATSSGEGNAPPLSDWESFKAFHGKVFANSENEKIRKKIFLKNAKAVESHNKAFAEGKVSYQKELNAFADIDGDSFSANYCGYKPSNDTRTETMSSASDFSNVGQLDTNFDWKAKGMVTPVKYQGRCGSCWAFAAVGAMESQILIKGENQQILSEEQVVDCDKRSHGCDGGLPILAWRYIKEAGGITTEEKYPYSAGNGHAGQCHFDLNGAVAHVSDYGRIEKNADTIMKGLVSKGPLAIALDGRELQMYSKGVYSCRSSNLSHAVLLVGYGNDGGKDYWLIKNSWGSRWGEKGYAKVQRGAGKDCGITKDVAYVNI
ncbi:cathepsin L1 isoform X1 [Folsomia candida]|uniref:cathepsin L1 isoform X1 n=1 Tax=Folsomia candida TaxID=158441 RepID=UPI0016050DAD|nr:cathepsin L1 isoform X1 [Folsomia candida]